MDALTKLIEGAPKRTEGPWGKLRQARGGIMLHYDASASDLGGLSFLLSKGCKVSYNYYVLDDGRVVQITPVNARAFHAGVCRPSSSRFQYKDANSFFYGVAIAAKAGDQATPAQIKTVRELCDKLCASHGWKLADVLTTHEAEAWPRGRKADTGKVLTIQQILDYKPGIETSAPVKPLAWGAKVSPEFRQKVRQISARLGCDPNDLMACMAFETGRTFSPSVRNRVSGATGLIQFMPATAQRFGLTTTDLAAMSAIEQLDIVERYFRPYIGKLKSIDDLYMSILWPRAVGKEEDYVLFAEGTKAYEQNKGLDRNRDGRVTKADAAASPRRLLQEGLRAENMG